MGKSTERKKDRKEKAPDDGGAGPSTSSGLPAHLEVQRTRVICGADMNFHVSQAARRAG